MSLSPDSVPAAITAVHADSLRSGASREITVTNPYDSYDSMTVGLHS